MLPSQLLVVPLVGVAARQDQCPGEAAGLDPRQQQLTEPSGFALRGMTLNTDQLACMCIEMQASLQLSGRGVITSQS